MNPRGSIGLRVKTGKAIAIVLRGPAEAPVVIGRRELTLANPNSPATLQPYHQVLDLPWEKAVADVRPIISEIQAIASQALEAVIRETGAANVDVIGVAVVGGSGGDPAKIANPHVRAHAAEGRLFCEVVETAAEQSHLAHRFFVERGVEKRAASELGKSPSSLKTRLAEFGRAAGRPWRAEEKSAALAAWMVLAGQAGK